MTALSPRLLFTGSYFRRLSANRRLHLPQAYDLKSAPVWFLVPSGEAPSDRILCLYAEQRTFMRCVIKEATGTDITDPSVEEGIDALRIITLQKGLNHHLVSAWIPVPRSNHIILSQAQVDWLGVKSRRLRLTGSLNSVQLRSVVNWRKLFTPSRRHLRRFAYSGTGS